jgi:hypothetical protein
MNHVILKALVLFIAMSLFGCATPKSVIDLGNKTAASQKITAERHLNTLSTYRNSLSEFKTDIRLMLNFIIKQQQLTDSTIDEARKSAIKMKVDEAVGQYDLKAIDLLTDSLEKKIEENFWPPISQKYADYKTEEDMAKQKLVTSPGDPIFQKQYREYGIVAEYILRFAYKEESQIRQAAFVLYANIRQSLKTEAMSIISNQITIQSDQDQDIKAQLEAIESNIDTAIASIDQASVEIKAALDNEAQAIKQINDYLIRPREWELVLQGISSEINNVVGGYTSSLKEAITSKVAIPMNQLLDKITSLDLSGLIEDKINVLNEKIDSKISDLQSKVINNKYLKENGKSELNL